MKRHQFVKFRRPVRVNASLTTTLRKALQLYNIEVPKGWTIWATDTKRGRCASRSRTLTVPIWAMNKGTEYLLWYACHEISHILAPSERGNVHGPKFMAALISICPEDSLHYELGYKPRLAAAAGISQKESNK
jgi:hypothetical protein